MFKAVSEYYAEDDHAKRVDSEILLARLARKYPKHQQVFSTFMSNLVMDSPNNVVKEVTDLKLSDIKGTLASAFTVHDNEKAIDKLLDEYYTLLHSKDDGVETSRTYNSVSVGDIATEVSDENKIQLWPRELNDAIGGGLTRGHHVMYFGRPDVGKSTFACEAIAGFLAQGLRVMYVGNEDPPEQLIWRFMQRILQKPERFILNNMEKADEVLSSRNWGNFYFEEMTPGTPAEIRKRIDEIRPDVVLVDQARNVDMGIDNRTRQLEAVEQMIRNVGKQYRMATISFTQAGDSGHNKLRLEMNDVDSSNTGMQASADLMIGIGCNEEAEMQSWRMLSFPKNKLNGNKQPIKVNINFAIYKVGSDIPRKQ